MENIYTTAMEIGLENIDGITYPDLKEIIEDSLNLEINPETEYGLLEWFWSHFTTIDNIRTPGNRKDTSELVLSYYRSKNDNLLNTIIDFKRAIFVIKGQTVKQYIDYLELKESREQSQRAFSQANESLALSRESIKISNKSFWVAIWAFTIPTVLAFYFNSNRSETPIPPFEVKIIEDKTSTPQLKKEVKELKEELYKAEMLISTYELENDKKG